MIRIKNNTGSERKYFGQVIPASAYYTLDYNEYWAWGNDPDVLSDIDSQTLVVNNGTIDLVSTSAGKNFLKGVEKTLIANINTTTPINSNNYNTLSVSPWLKSRNPNYSSGEIILEAEVTGKTLLVRLYDVTHSVVLGSLNITSSGFYTFNVNLPSSDARLEIQAKNSGSGQDPAIHAAYLELNA